MTAEKLLELDPNNQRVRDNLVHYTKPVPSDLLTVKEDVPVADNLLANSKVVIDKYRRLCRQEYVKPVVPQSGPEPFCERNTYGRSTLAIKPIKVEHITFGDISLKVRQVSQLISVTPSKIYRNFASVAECQHLMDLASDSLALSVAYERSKYVPVKFRTRSVQWWPHRHADRGSSVHWVDPAETPMVERMHKRIEDATSLNISLAEMLQVSNCKHTSVFGCIYAC